MVPLTRTPPPRTCDPRWRPEPRQRRQATVAAQARARIPRSPACPTPLRSWSNSAHIRPRRRRLRPRQGLRERNRLLQTRRRSSAQTRWAEALSGRGAQNAARTRLCCGEGGRRTPGAPRFQTRKPPAHAGQGRCTDTGTQHADTPTHKHSRNKDGPELRTPARPALGAQARAPSCKRTAQSRNTPRKEPRSLCSQAPGSSSPAQSTRRATIWWAGEGARNVLGTARLPRRTGGFGRPRPSQPRGSPLLRRLQAAALLALGAAATHLPARPGTGC